MAKGHAPVRERHWKSWRFQTTKNCFPSDKVTATRLLEAADDRCLYQRLLGEAWHTLPKTLKALHSASPRPQMGGKATVTSRKGQ